MGSSWWWKELDDSGYLDWLSDKNELNTDFSVEDFEEPDEVSANTDEEMNEIMDEEQREILDRLKEIGLQEDYYEFINADFLEEISTLPVLTDKQRNYLYDDIINIKDGMSFFQNETNEVLRHLITMY